MPAIIFSFIYLLYLSLICQTLFIYDSAGYIDLGQRMLHTGLLGYIHDGPQREPLYPLLIAAAMRLGEHFNADYVWCLKLLQILLLNLAQLAAYFILGGLGVHGLVRGAAVLYMGISPVLVNSTMWVYSEIVALPLLLLVIVCAANAWQGIVQEADWKQQMTNGGVLGLSLASCVFIKSIFEIVAPFLLLPFAAVAWQARRRKDFKLFSNTLRVLLFSLLFFYAPVLGYKALNKAVNDQFAFTDRAGFALYGNTARRIEPLTARRLAANLAYTVNPHFCYRVADPQVCDFWSYKPSDIMGLNKYREVQQNGVAPDKVDGVLFKLSVQKALENPFQYIFLAILETLKMPFWETSKAGQVTYPDWLETIYERRNFEYLLVAITALLSVAALAYMMMGTVANRQKFLNPLESYKMGLALMVIGYAGAHSFFFVLQRYSLPLAPLWIIMIAAWARRCLG